MTPAEQRLRQLLAEGVLDLPRPAGGATAERFRDLHDLASREDLSVARLAEAHADAAAIVAEAGRSLPADSLAGVWASRYGGSDIDAEQTSAGWHVTGRLRFCSGAPLLDVALVDAARPDGRRQLLVVPLRTAGITIDMTRWHTGALASTATASVTFDVEVSDGAAIGDADFYLDRLGFWHGGIGVAACWAGGASAVHEATLAHAPPDQPHAAANVGRTAAECWGMGALLARAGHDIDVAPASVDRPYALMVRQLVAAACERVVAASRRATGPGPYVFDPDHARRVDDLILYVEQQHHEIDLADVGETALRRRSGIPLMQEPRHGR